MPIPTFNPAVRPSPGTGRNVELSLNKSSFGDGYTQASPKGLNHIRRVITLKWDALTMEQAYALDAFFVGRGGYKPFNYTIRGDIERKWTCEEWAMSDAAPFSFTATIKECFALTT